MTEFKYAKSYSRKQYDGCGTRFRTDGTVFQMEVFHPLTVKETDPVVLVNEIKSKSDSLIDPLTSTVHLVHGDAPDETFLVVSGWTETMSVYERSIPTLLTFH